MVSLLHRATIKKDKNIMSTSAMPGGHNNDKIVQKSNKSLQSASESHMN